ncbi:hypothetical protein BLNAU_13191 [Blattamonas nauphoetae]|uniref:Uncharacterized protein n=1 Tax=Blattamonas nauphoetae TaxID=2049346 RepID=A0ABQ9XHA2_9EUKA|nr:hypothetical protein BLNAU_13191 [Blattamonas nauphoetae]
MHLSHESIRVLVSPGRVTLTSLFFSVLSIFTHALAVTLQFLCTYTSFYLFSSYFLHKLVQRFQILRNFIIPMGQSLFGPIHIPNTFSLLGKYIVKEQDTSLIPILRDDLARFLMFYLTIVVFIIVLFSLTYSFVSLLPLKFTLFRPSIIRIISRSVTASLKRLWSFIPRLLKSMSERVMRSMLDPSDQLDYDDALLDHSQDDIEGDDPMSQRTKAEREQTEERERSRLCLVVDVLKYHVSHNAPDEDDTLNDRVRALTSLSSRTAAVHSLQYLKERMCGTEPQDSLYVQKTPLARKFIFETDMRDTFNNLVYSLSSYILASSSLFSTVPVDANDLLDQLTLHLINRGLEKKKEYKANQSQDRQNPCVGCFKGMFRCFRGMRRCCGLFCGACCNIKTARLQDHPSRDRDDTFVLGEDDEFITLSGRGMMDQRSRSITREYAGPEFDDEEFGAGRSLLPFPHFMLLRPEDVTNLKSEIEQVKSTLWRSTERVLFNRDGNSTNKASLWDNWTMAAISRRPPFATPSVHNQFFLPTSAFLRIHDNAKSFNDSNTNLSSYFIIQPPPPPESLLHQEQATLSCTIPLQALQNDGFNCALFPPPFLPHASICAITNKKKKKDSSIPITLMTQPTFQNAQPFNPYQYTTTVPTNSGVIQTNHVQFAPMVSQPLQQSIQQQYTQQQPTLPQQAVYQTPFVSRPSDQVSSTVRAVRFTPYPQDTQLQMPRTAMARPQQPFQQQLQQQMIGAQPYPTPIAPRQPLQSDVQMQLQAMSVGQLFEQLVSKLKEVVRDVVTPAFSKFFAFFSSFGVYLSSLLLWLKERIFCFGRPVIVPPFEKYCSTILGCVSAVEDAVRVLATLLLAAKNPSSHDPTNGRTEDSIGFTQTLNHAAVLHPLQLLKTSLQTTWSALELYGIKQPTEDDNSPTRSTLDTAEAAKDGVINLQRTLDTALQQISFEYSGELDGTSTGSISREFITPSLHLTFISPSSNVTVLQQMNTSQERSQPPVDEIEIAYNMLSRDLQQYAYTSESIENLNMTYDQLAPEKEELERRKIAIEEEEKNDIVQNAQKTDESQVQQVLERTSQRLMSDYWMRILGDEIVDIFAGELEERGIPNLKGNGFEFLLQFPLTTITSNSTVRLRFTTPRNQFTPSNLLFIQTDASTLTFIRDKLSNFTTDSHQEPWNTFVGGETHILDLLRNGIQNSQPSGTPVDDSQEQTPQQAIEKQQNIARTNEILFMLQQEERNSQNTILSSLSKFLSSLRFFILSLH